MIHIVGISDKLQQVKRKKPLHQKCPLNKTEQTGDDKVREQVDTLLKVLHIVNFNTSVQTLKLLSQVMNSPQMIADQNYAALHGRC